MNSIKGGDSDPFEPWRREGERRWDEEVAEVSTPKQRIAPREEGVTPKREEGAPALSNSSPSDKTLHKENYKNALAPISFVGGAILGTVAALAIFAGSPGSSATPQVPSVSPTSSATPGNVNSKNERPSFVQTVTIQGPERTVTAPPKTITVPPETVTATATKEVTKTVTAPPIQPTDSPSGESNSTPGGGGSSASEPTNASGLTNENSPITSQISPGTHEGGGDISPTLP